MVQTSAVAAEGRVVALGDRMTVVEALGTDDDADLAHCWLVTDGGLVADRVASLAVVVIRTGDRKTLVLEVGIAVLLELALLLLKTVLLLVLSLLLLLLLLLRLKLLILVVVLAILVVAIVLIGRVFKRPPVAGITTGDINVGSFTVRVHVA